MAVRTYPESVNKWAGHVHGKRFVWLGSPPWDGVWTRQNHFAQRLAALGAEVLYQEAPSSWRARLRDRTKKSNRVAVREVERGLYVMSAPLHLPGANYLDTIAEINGALISSALRDWLVSNNWKEFVCWCRLPVSVFALRKLIPNAIVYDVTDDYALYAKRDYERKRCRSREALLAARADIVFIASQELRKNQIIKSKEPVWLPNGVDYDSFAQASLATLEMHPRLREIRKPIIGYVGLISHWMDFDLLAQLAQRWPGQVVMVGPVHPDVQKHVDSLKNIHWLGFVPHTEVPRYLRGFDVCILPQKVSELRHRANPLKIWEYLATGKPVVSVALRMMETMTDVVEVAQDHPDFMRRVMQCLENPGTVEQISRRMTTARAFSWDTLFDRMMTSLQTRVQ